ncbi:hypothetical protein RRSWK_02047 [Rhodopirellula sp. SWK7]|nr:hypothetical protein RRSWK_02047 [Rhodopirellula sp. SWK7]
MNRADLARWHWMCCDELRGWSTVGDFRRGGGEVYSRLVEGTHEGN